jgi:hypothetical protein
MPDKVLGDSPSCAVECTFWRMKKRSFGMS